MTSANLRSRSSTYLLRLFRSIDLAAIFRVLLAFAIAMQLLQLLRFEDVLFAPDAKIVDLLPLHYFLLIYLLILFGLAAGVHKTFAILNYVFAVILFGFYLQHLHLDYHADGFLISGSFCLCLLPVRPIWNVSPASSETRERQALVGFLILSFIAISYLDSSSFKIQSILWRHGLGYWTPASLPFISTGAFAFLLDTEWLIKVIGYSVLAFEITMPILIQFRTLRLGVICAGILFHLGIGLIYPIPLFGLTMIALYAGGGLAVGCSDRLRPFRARGQRGWNLAIIMITWFVWIAGMAFFILTPQVSWELRLPQNVLQKLEGQMQTAYGLLGMSHHPIFIDGHFKNGRIEYRYELQAIGKQYNIPLSGEPTEAGNYTSDRIHSFWLFTVGQNNEVRYPLLRKFAHHQYQAQTGGSLPSVHGAEILCYKRKNYVPLDRWIPNARVENERTPWTFDTAIFVNPVR